MPPYRVFEIVSSPERGLVKWLRDATPHVRLASAALPVVAGAYVV